MIYTRTALTAIWTAAGAAFCLGALRSLMILLSHASAAAAIREVLTPALLLAHIIATVLAIVVTLDLPRGSAMRRAWWLMSASGASACVRYIVEWIAEWSNWTAATEPLIGIRQIPGVVALILLVASLSLIWMSFARMGIGLSLRSRDLLAILAVVVLLPPIVLFRENLADAGSMYSAIRHMQFSQPFLLACSGALAIVLLHISEEVGDGQLSRSLKYLAWFLILRLVLMMCAIVPAIQQIVPLKVVRGGCNGAMPWLFTLAIAYRWKLVADARTALGQVWARPAQEVALPPPAFMRK